MPTGIVAGAIFALLLVAVCIRDVRFRRIPNQLVAALAIAGTIYALVVLPPPAAVRQVLGGGATALVVWLPFWMARVLGAGDVKLAAASGAWLGAAGMVEASLVAAVVGGALAVWALSRRGGLAAGATRFGAWMVASRVSGAIAPELTPTER